MSNEEYNSLKKYVKGIRQRQRKSTDDRFIMQSIVNKNNKRKETENYARRYIRNNG